MSDKKNIRAYSVEELKNFFLEKKEKTFRALQVYEWLWKKSARSFDEMSNLPKAIRQWLSSEFFIPAAEIIFSQVSKDKTIKNVFRLHDGNRVESVLIPSDRRMTACISSQVGCSLTCSFCATGSMKRIRNLDAGEMYDQAFLLGKQAQEKYRISLTNIVFMGMGEPLLNYQNVLSSVEKITSPDGMGMSSQRITVSTAGISKMIKKLGDDRVQFNFALSLHAANDEKRNSIMPINEQNNLASLADALKYFYNKTGTRVTYEYILFHHFNDSLTDAKELEQFCRVIPCKINIIEYNPVANRDFRQTSGMRLKKFVGYLRNRKIIVNLRRSRGKDIDAACGQLANKLPAAV